MASMFIAIITSPLTWSRIKVIFDNQALSNYNFFISSQEPEIEFIDYIDRSTLHSSWGKSIGLIRRSLYLNTMLVNSSSFNLNAQMSRGFESSEWLQPRLLRLSEYSCYYKHITALGMFARSKYDYGLFIEDDVEVESNALTKTESIVDIMNPEYIDLSQTSGMSIPQSIPTANNSSAVHLEEIKDIKISSIPWMSSRTSATYLVSKSMAFKILEANPKYILPYDLFLTYVLHAEKIIPYWADGVGYLHKSSYGLIKSSTRMS